MSWKSIKRLGLSENQAKVLYNVMLLGEGKVSQIAEASEVSRVRVYDILKELYSMGLVKKIEARPTRYKALKPSKTIDRYLDFKKEEFEEEKERIEENKRDIENSLSDAFERREDEKPKNILELIPLGKVSEKETKNILKKAEQVKIISESLSYIDSVKEELKRDNLQVKVLLRNKDQLEERGKKAYQRSKKILEESGAEIRHVEEMPLRGTITDSKAIINIEDKESSNLLRDCIETNHESFVEAMNTYFDNIWKDSAN